MATRTVLAVLVLAVSAGHAQEAVRVTEGDQLVVLDNGIVAASVAKASGDLV